MKKFRTTKPGLATLLDGLFFYIIKHQYPGQFTIESDDMMEHEFDDWKTELIRKLDSAGARYEVVGWQMKSAAWAMMGKPKNWTGYLTIEFQDAKENQ